MTKTKKKSEWAKLPLRWIHEGGLVTFTDTKLKKTRVSADERWTGREWTEAWLHDKEARNTCIAALRLYLVLCCRADYKSGEAAVTYPELMKLAHMSRPIVARSIKRLVTAGLIRRKEQPRKEGSVIIIERWNEDYGWGKIPKFKLYDGNEAGQMLLLAQFNAEAINRLYAMDLISYRPGNFNSGSTDDRTNHYLVKGLSARWPSPSQVEWSAPASSLHDNF